jgi:hypothetical protein
LTRKTNKKRFAEMIIEITIIPVGRQFTKPDLTANLNLGVSAYWFAFIIAQITKQASARGTSIHKLCEHYILGTMDDVQIMPSNKEMFNAMASHLAETVGKVYAVEGFLYSDFLRTAGQVDMVAEYNGTLSIVDFKTAKKKKREDWIQNYFVQEAAYSFMFEERTGLQVPQLVTVIGVDGESEPQVFIKNTKERNQYLLQFLALREQFEEATVA